MIPLVQLVAIIIQQSQNCLGSDLYFRFALSFRDVEEMLAMRGVSLSYETVRLYSLGHPKLFTAQRSQEVRAPSVPEVFISQARITGCDVSFIYNGLTA